MTEETFKPDLDSMSPELRASVEKTFAEQDKIVADRDRAAFQTKADNALAPGIGTELSPQEATEMVDVLLARGDITHDQAVDFLKPYGVEPKPDTRTDTERTLAQNGLLHVQPSDYRFAAAGVDWSALEAEGEYLTIEQKSELNSLAADWCAGMGLPAGVAEAVVSRMIESHVSQMEMSEEQLQLREREETAKAMKLIRADTIEDFERKMAPVWAMAEEAGGGLTEKFTRHGFFSASVVALLFQHFERQQAIAAALEQEKKAAQR